MMIKDATTGNRLVSRKRFAKNFFQRMRGLMFTLPIFEEGLIFVFPQETKASLHMFFVFYPIDILWLDKQKKVIDQRKSVWPFTPLVIPKEKAKYVIELPPYTLDNSETEPGNKISF